MLSHSSMQQWADGNLPGFSDTARNHRWIPSTTGQTHTSTNSRPGTDLRPGCETTYSGTKSCRQQPWQVFIDCKTNEYTLRRCNSSTFCFVTFLNGYRLILKWLGHPGTIKQILTKKVPSFLCKSDKQSVLTKIFDFVFCARI